MMPQGTNKVKPIKTEYAGGAISFTSGSLFFSLLC